MIKPCWHVANRIPLLLCIVVVAALAVGIGVPASAGSAPQYVGQWGSLGTGDNQFGYLSHGHGGEHERVRLCS
jgi:hypothetical protein